MSPPQSIAHYRIVCKLGEGGMGAGATWTHDIAPDGKRAIVLPIPDRMATRGTAHVTVLLNFFDELRRRLP